MFLPATGAPSAAGRLPASAGAHLISTKACIRSGRPAAGAVKRVECRGQGELRALARRETGDRDLHTCSGVRRSCDMTARAAWISCSDTRPSALATWPHDPEKWCERSARRSAPRSARRCRPRPGPPDPAGAGTGHRTDDQSRPPDCRTDRAAGHQTEHAADRFFRSIAYADILALMTSATVFRNRAQRHAAPARGQGTGQLPPSTTRACSSSPTDRLSAFDVILPDPIPRQGPGADADLQFLVRPGPCSIVPNHLTDGR